MTISALLVFAGALFVASASPGPSVAALVARVLARGSGGALAFMLGFAVGDVIWLTAAVLGLAFIAKTFAAVFLAIKYLGCLYLLYLAWRMWTATVATAATETPAAEKPSRLFVTALFLALGNPKIMVFYLALLPSLVDLAAVTFGGYLALVAVTFAVLTVVDGSYVLLAGRMRRLLASPRALRLVNRGSGAVMAGAAVAIASR
jgi:threonine/homoserine/homoserine lactone efflux protein